MSNFHEAGEARAALQEEVTRRSYSQTELLLDQSS